MARSPFPDAAPEAIAEAVKRSIVRTEVEGSHLPWEHHLRNGIRSTVKRSHAVLIGNTALMTANRARHGARTHRRNKPQSNVSCAHHATRRRLSAREQGEKHMRSYPRDWIAWMLVAAIIVVAAVELVAAASATQTSRTAEDCWTTPAVERV